MCKKLIVMLFLLSTQLTYADQLTDKKKLVIDEILEITGALKAGEMMGVAFADQMISALSKQRKDVSPKVIRIIKDEVGNIMHDEFIANGFINEISYDIYHKHFSMVELEEMVAFYKTPTGNKMASLLPQITQEAMMAGQQHGQSLAPIIHKRLMARFKKEGV